MGPVGASWGSVSGIVRIVRIVVRIVVGVWMVIGASWGLLGPPGASLSLLGPPEAVIRA